MVDVIETEEEHTTALARISEIFDAEPNTPEGTELNLLVTAVEDYEKIHFPIGTE